MTTSTRVAVRGTRKSIPVEKTATKLETTDFYTVVDQPSGKYHTHFIPASGSGKDISNELVAIARGGGRKIKALGNDGTSTNTGVDNGVVRKFEEELETPVQHLSCLFHINELPLRHVGLKLDGTTSGPASFSGPIGQKLAQNVWELKVVNFSLVKAKTEVIPQDVLDDLSTDSNLLYRLSQIVDSGVVDPKVVCAVLGPLFHARWNTYAERALRLWLSTPRPSVPFQKLIQFIQQVYVPIWFHIKSHPHCQDGSKNFFKLIQLVMELPKTFHDIVLPVLQWNGWWAHPENIIIGMLSDDRKVIRTKAVLYIMAARKEKDSDKLRKFVVPKIKFEANFYFDMADLDTGDKMEPPLTMDISDEVINSAVETPLILPAYPCHTQSVERAVGLVSEAAKHRVGFVNRHR